jgi:hypothetical protein
MKRQLPRSKPQAQCRLDQILKSCGNEKLTSIVCATAPLALRVNGVSCSVVQCDRIPRKRRIRGAQIVCRCVII